MRSSPTQAAWTYHLIRCGYICLSARPHTDSGAAHRLVSISPQALAASCKTASAMICRCPAVSQWAHRAAPQENLSDLSACPSASPPIALYSSLYYIWHEKGRIVPILSNFFEIFWKNLGMERIEKIWINYTRKMWINLLLPRTGKKITGTWLSPNTRYLVYQPRLTDAIIVISWITFLWAPV